MATSYYGHPAIPSFEVRGFRAFQNLRIDRLGQVTLIVGRNSTGKSTLLEAIRVFAEGADPTVLRSILLARGELALDDEESTRDEVERLFFAYARLFYGREDAYDPSRAITLGPVGDPERALSIRLGFFDAEEEAGQLRLLDTPAAPIVVGGRPALSIRSADLREVVVPLETTTRLYRRRLGFESVAEREPRSVLVPASGLTANRVGLLWDRIALTDLEDEVLAGLRLISHEIQRLSLVASSERVATRTVVLKVNGFRRPVPLQSMGDGANRMLGIVLALVNARNGILLLDEIENGIHYSVQPDMWKLVFSLATRLNVQVFATTHSYDCVRTFDEAARESPEVGMLVRLERRGNSVRSVPFDERELGIATREEIEVR